MKNICHPTPSTTYFTEQQQIKQVKDTGDRWCRIYVSVTQYNYTIRRIRLHDSAKTTIRFTLNIRHRMAFHQRETICSPA